MSTPQKIPSKWQILWSIYLQLFLPCSTKISVIYLEAFAYSLYDPAGEMGNLIDTSLSLGFTLNAAKSPLTFNGLTFLPHLNYLL